MENEKCPLNLCDGSGVITYEDNTYSECQCRKAMHLQVYISDALIPEGYRNKTFHDFEPANDEQKEMIAKLNTYVQYWPDYRRQGLGISFISEQTRVGKSHLACAVGHALIEKYQHGIEDDVVVFVNVTNWVDKWRAFYARFPKDTSEIVDEVERQKEIEKLIALDNRMNNADLLILDDIGEVPGTEYVSSKLYSVAEYRTSNLLPILMTSNHPWNIIAKKYGDDGVRIVDRIKEKSLELTFFFDRPLKRKVKKGSTGPHRK